MCFNCMYVIQTFSGVTPMDPNLMSGHEIVICQGPRPSVVHILYGAEDRNILLGVDHHNVLGEGGGGKLH